MANVQQALALVNWGLCHKDSRVLQPRSCTEKLPAKAGLPRAKGLQFAVTPLTSLVSSVPCPAAAQECRPLV